MAEPRCVGLQAGFVAAFVRWRPDPWNPGARWRDVAVFSNGVEIGPRSARWKAEPVGLTPETIC